MAIAERPMRVITCVGDEEFKGCGKTEQRSPFGGIPKLCLECGEKKSRVTKRARNESRPGRRGPYRTGITRSASPGGYDR